MEITYKGLEEMYEVEMFEGDSANMCVHKFPVMSMGARAEGLGCADPGARTPISHLEYLRFIATVWGVY